MSADTACDNDPPPTGIFVCIFFGFFSPVSANTHNNIIYTHTRRTQIHYSGTTVTIGRPRPPPPPPLRLRLRPVTATTYDIVSRLKCDVWRVCAPASAAFALNTYTRSTIAVRFWRRSGHGPAGGRRNRSGKQWKRRRRRRILVQQTDQADGRVPDDRRHPAHHIQVGLVIVGQDRELGKVDGGKCRRGGSVRCGVGETARLAAQEQDEAGLESDGPEKIGLSSRYANRIVLPLYSDPNPHPGCSVVPVDSSVYLACF